MKNICVIAFLLLASFSLYAQNDYWIDEETEQGFVLVGRWNKTDDFPGYSVRIYKDSDVFFLLLSLYDDTQIGGRRILRISGKDYASFEKNMFAVNEKFAKWTQTAKTDGVTNFEKTIPVDFGDELVYCNNSGNYLTELYAVFYVDSSGDCHLRLDDRENESSNHRPFIWIHSQEALNELCETIKFDNAMKNYDIMKAKLDARKKAAEDRDAKFD